MKVSITRWLVFVAVVFGVTFLIASVPPETVLQDDTAALYKSKWFACHGARLRKKFDKEKADDELIQIVLKGRDGEAAQYAGYEEKGITADQSKAWSDT